MDLPSAHPRFVEEVVGANLKRFGEADDIPQRDVPFTTFHAANVGPMDTSAGGKRFLANAHPLA